MINPHGADHCVNFQDDKFASEMALGDLRPWGQLEPLPLSDISARKVAAFKIEQARKIMNNCFVMCSFIGGALDFQQLTNLLITVTGWDTSPIEQLRVAERVLTMDRLFNIRQGLTAADDVLPQRFFEPKANGALSKTSLDPEKMKQARSYYYTIMGWDPETGIPLPGKLNELGID
jgi:aldehyde:ferredoxin oxidoreductase